MGKTKATFGQQLLGIRFKLDQLTNTKLVLFQLFTVGASYVQSKVESPSKNYINKVKHLRSLVFVHYDPVTKYKQLYFLTAVYHTIDFLLNLLFFFFFTT